MITIYEEDEFPIYVNTKENTIACQGFCNQCNIDLKLCKNCKQIILRLAKVKEALVVCGLYYDTDIYEYDYYAEDFIDDVIYNLKFLYEEFEVNSEIVSRNERITICIEKLENIKIDDKEINFV